MKYQFAEFVFDARTRELTSEDGGVQLLQPKVAGVLAALAAAHGQQVSKEDLLRDVWNGVAVSDGSVARAVRLARLAVGDSYRDSALIATSWRQGYRLNVPVRILEALPGPASGGAGEDSSRPAVGAAGSGTPGQGYLAADAAGP